MLRRKHNSLGRLKLNNKTGRVKLSRLGKDKRRGRLSAPGRVKRSKHDKGKLKYKFNSRLGKIKTLRTLS